MVLARSFGANVRCTHRYYTIHRCMYLPNLCTYLRATHLSVCLSVCLSISHSLSLSLCLSVCLPVRVSIYLYLFVCLSICLSIYLPVYLSVYLSVYVYVCLRIYPSICHIDKFRGSEQGSGKHPTILGCICIHIGLSCWCQCCIMKQW